MGSKRRKKIALGGLIGGIAIAAASYTPDKSVAELRRYVRDDSRFVDVRGMRVHYRITGPESAPVLALLHGTNSSLHTWDGWHHALGDRFRLISLDLPGYGLTGPPPDRAIAPADYMRFFDEFFDAVDERPSMIAGNSFGGFLAWRYGEHRPDQVDALVLLAPGGLDHYGDGRVSVGMRLMQWPVTRPIARRVTPTFVVRRVVESMYGNPALVSDDIVERYRDLLLREGNRGVNADIRAGMVSSTADRAATEARLAALPQRVLIQWGGHDVLRNLDVARAFERVIPGARLIEYSDAGHVLMEEIPTRTAEDAARFLLADE